MGNFLVRHYRSLFTILLIIMLFLAFLMGFLTGKQHMSPAVTLSCSPDVMEKLAIPLKTLSATAAGEPQVSQVTTGAFVGSKNGTKYYGPNCATVKRIKPENYIWFENAQDAQLQGYTPGAC